MLVVVGGHSRNIGKTSVTAGLIRALPARNWTAMKITQFGHNIGSVSGRRDCCLEPECPFAVTRELQPNDSDSGRFLAAGARQSYWVRTAGGRLRYAMPAITEIYVASENLIVESNSIVEFLTPDVYLTVLDFSQPDFKPTSRRFLNRADAAVMIARDLREPLWKDVDRGTWHSLPRFVVCPPDYVTPALADFVEARLRRGSTRPLCG